MSENERKEKKETYQEKEYGMQPHGEQDIWVKGIKTICGHHKKALLDYVDALERKINQQESNCLGMIKAKIHNDLSQIQLMIGILFETHRSGGSIKPFEDSFARSSQGGRGRERERHAPKVHNTGAHASR